MKVRQGLTFDDVLLVPRHSTIPSRSLISLEVDLGKGIKPMGPLVSANMKNVTEVDMARVMESYGLAILHRFATLEEQHAVFRRAKEWVGPGVVGCSVGVGKDDFKNANSFVDAGCAILCVDVAHGDSRLAIEMVERIAKHHPGVLLIAGNVATAGGARRLHEAGADVIKVGIGGGCHAAGTRVLMSNGFYKNIEDVIPGDRVINKNGKPVTVLQSFSSGIRKVNKLRHSLFYKPTYVTPDHRHWIGDLTSLSKKTVKSKGYAKSLTSNTKKGNSKYKWQEIRDVKRSCLLMPKEINFELEKYFEIKLEKRCGGNGKRSSPFQYKTDCTIEPSYNAGYMFGTFLGDGCAMLANNGKTDTGAVYWYFGLDEWEIVDKLRVAVRKATKKRITITKKNNIIKCSLYYKPLADYLASFGKKQEKALPSNLLIQDKNYLQGLLDGLIDSDGHVEQCGRIRFINTSPKLIELFNVVSYLLTGIFPNNEKTREPSVGGLKNANIENCSPSFIASILKSGEKRLTDNYQVIKMLENENAQLEIPTYDIGVDCDTHSFIANNVIVHNSLCTTRIETGAGVPQLTALHDVYEESKNKQATYIDALGAFATHVNNRKFKIIADGGVRSAGDCVKALCFSDAVMLGSLLAGTDETPGGIEVDTTGKRYKTYAGSSTHKSNRVEGVVRKVPCKGSAKHILTKLTEGIQSGLSYQNCINLKELKEDPEFIQISSAGLIESHPHTY